LAFWKYDFAFIYFYRLGLIPAIFARLFSKKVIFTGGIDFLNRSSVTQKQYLIQSIFFRLCNLFSHVNILVSEFDRKNVKLILPNLSESKNPTCYHAIDTNLLFIGKENTKIKMIKTIAWMGKVENILRKGVDRSIILFKELLKVDPEFKLVIIGTKGEGSELVEQIIIEHDLSEYVFLAGALSETEKIDYLKKSLFYFQLSRYEGFGIAAIEALATENIVVHYNEAGLQESVGNNGIIVDLSVDPAVIIHNLLFICNSNRGEEMRKMGKIFVDNNFMYKRRVEGFKKILATIDK
jgi:glycosyltransferase involved in cell wall biosynthesis